MKSKKTIEEISTEKVLLSEKIIVDYFYLDSNKIVILDNRAFPDVDKEALILAKEVEDEKVKRIEPLTDEEYEKAIKKYDLIMDVIEEGEENE